MGKNINITLDGPSGSGKTTIAKSLASRLGYVYVDTGAMYRGVAWYMFSQGIAVDDEAGVVASLSGLKLELKLNNGEQKVIVNGTDITGQIRTPEISMGASTVSKIKDVRLKMVSMQRDIASSCDSIFDGRDMGSFVLPDADFKFYLTADVDERAKRRYLELKLKGMEVALEEVKTDMIKRDEQDSQRAFAPLVVPQGAFVIDTTNLTIDEVENMIIQKIKK
ncbi:MAG: (d)CMP kinase [Clostridia bacterium]|nr:(d)CMP kinase [Clostridia bacterium]